MIRRPRRGLSRRTKVLGVLILVVLMLLGIWRLSSTRVERKIARVANHPADGMLYNTKDNNTGSIRLEQSNGVYKVVYAVQAQAGEEATSYHGWLYDPARKEYRYAGAFYPVQDNQFSLTYTTEENIGRFRQALISRETLAQPAAPSEIIAGGTLLETELPDIVVPSVSPDAVIEVTPSPEETAVSSATAIPPAASPTP